MTEPATSGFVLWDILKWLGGALVALLTYFGKRHDDRLTALEKEAQTREQAAAERAEIRQEIRDLASRMEVQHTRLFERLDLLVDRSK